MISRTAQLRRYRLLKYSSTAAGTFRLDLAYIAGDLVGGRRRRSQMVQPLVRFNSHAIATSYNSVAVVEASVGRSWQLSGCLLP